MAEPKLTTDAFEAAVKRGEKRRQGPHAVGAHYDAGRGRVIVELSTGYDIGFAPGDAQGLRGAVREDLEVIEVTPFGLGIHFPRLDADLYLPALLEGVFGSREWEAARMGAAGGKARSEAKAAAARKNGSQGGRPRRIAVG